MTILARYLTKLSLIMRWRDLLGDFIAVNCRRHFRPCRVSEYLLGRPGTESSF